MMKKQNNLGNIILIWLMAIVTLSGWLAYMNQTSHYDDKPYRFCMNMLYSEGVHDGMTTDLLQGCQAYLKIPVVNHN